MLRRLIYFVCYVIVILLVAWVLTEVVALLPVIPEALKSMLNLVIWAIAAVSILLMGVRMFADMVPSTP